MFVKLNLVFVKLGFTCVKSFVKIPHFLIDLTYVADNLFLFCFLGLSDKLLDSSDKLVDLVFSHRGLSAKLLNISDNLVDLFFSLRDLLSSALHALVDLLFELLILCSVSSS